MTDFRNIFYSPKVVLVRPLYDSNIGASSRAMANMGAEELILIAPQCEVTYAAQQAAATGQNALQNRKTYANWKDFFSEHSEGLRIAFTARDGQERLVENFNLVLNNLKNHPWVSLSDNHELNNEISVNNPENPLSLYLIFGPEDWGLSAEDLEQTHFAASLPVYGLNPSFNLAQAVLLALFILRTEWGGHQKDLLLRKVQTRSQTEQTTKSLFPTETLQEFLLSLGIKHEDRGVSAWSVFQRMLLRTVPTQKELQIIEVIFRQATRKLREYQLMKKN